ncbi:hypothetical protein J3E07_000634 [Methanococcus voltae]|uniref:NurA domain-containing protein n=1 Tax=Methanococcus voltae TaxID=2188 RepID=A0A8J7RHZ1_METVO|nr:DNA double-strand break repair nuclease NurA [Methanococcus voltae]MBP2201236.1 hypothetical protein [Methanococcus voltae]
MDYSKLKRNKEGIKNSIEQFKHEKIDCKNYWINKDFKENKENNENNQNNSNSLSKDYNFFAIDGSFNQRSFLDFSLYVVGAEAYGHKVGEKVTHLLNAWDSGVILPYQYSKRSRLEHYMATMELKLALCILTNNCSEPFDYYIYDGSVYSWLIHAKMNRLLTLGQYEHYINYFNEKYGEEFRMYLLNELNCQEINAYSNFYNDANIKDKEQTEELGDSELKVLFEQLEYNIILSELLKHKDRIIGVSKTSKMNVYFKDSLRSDMAIFSRCEPGYSKPLNLAEEDLKSKSTIDELRKFDIHIDTLNYQFLKFKKGAMGITSFKKLDEEVFDALYKITDTNYPYILKKCHEKVKISEVEMDKYVKYLGIYEDTERGVYLD